MKKLKWMAFVPMLAMMCLIWSFSAHSGEESSGQSLGIISRIIQVIEHVTDQEWTEEQEITFQEMIHTPIRKAAHMTEYLILELLTAVPFLLYKKRRSWIVKVSFIICSANILHFVKECHRCVGGLYRSGHRLCLVLFDLWSNPFI